MLSGVNTGSGGTGGANSGGSGYGGEAGTWNIVGAGEGGGTRLDPNAGGFWLNKDGSSGAGSGSGSGTGAAIPRSCSGDWFSSRNRRLWKRNWQCGRSRTWNILGGNAEGNPIDPNAGGFWLNKEDSRAEAEAEVPGEVWLAQPVHGGGSGHGAGSGDFGGGNSGGGNSGGFAGGTGSGSGVGNSGGSNPASGEFLPERARIPDLVIPADGQMPLRAFAWDVLRARQRALARCRLKPD